MTDTDSRERARSVEAEYARLAPSYDTRWAAYIERTVALTLAALPQHAPERVLDVGCGTGALLGPLAARYPDTGLAGIDASRAMLARARAALPPHVALAAARAEALPFRDASFDLVVSTSTLHFFGDLAAGAGEIARVMRPRGRVVVLDWCADFASMRVFDAVMRALGRANFTMLGTEGCTRLLTDAGFEAVDVATHRIGMLWGVMVARAERAAHENRTLDA